MNAAISRRATDEDCYFSNDDRVPGLALGMRRLSIIDLQGGQQPIWNESHNVAVIFNGELYNYRELRERLSMAGKNGTKTCSMSFAECLPSPCWICASISLPCRCCFSRVIRWGSSRFIIRKLRMDLFLRP